MLDKALLKEEAAERIGAWLKGKWQLDELIGVGGTGAVYRATHRNGGQVAIKMLHRQLSLDPKIRKRFLREGYVVNAVDLPGVVQIQDDDMTDDGCPFLVMELLEGETLAKLLEREGPVPAVRVSELARQLLATLAVAHDKGVLHRDIKPENLLVTADGTLKVLDFGLARVLELAPSSWSTDLGGVVGTAHYMPPEQARGRWDELDARSDLWSVGATLFTLLTGEPVHPAETVNESLGLAMYERARSVRGVEPGVPEPLAHVVDRALAFDQDERWQSAHDMRRALDDTRAAVTVAARPRRRLAWASLLGLSAVVGVVMLWPDASSKRRERELLARSGEPLRAAWVPNASSGRPAPTSEPSAPAPATVARPGPAASLPVATASAPSASSGAPSASAGAPSASADPFASRL